MAKKNDKETQLEGFEKVEATLSKTELYIEENKKNIIIIVAVLIAIIGGYMAYKNLYIKPLELEAQKEMFTAEQYFEKDSFKLALNGDGNYYGFEYIADNYSATATGNLANYYAGISHLHLGEFDLAIEYLNEFSSDDDFLGPISVGAIGDAQLELGKTEEAIASYKAAADKKKNDLTTPLYLMKAAQVLESQNKYAEALVMYETVKKDHKKSIQARDIDKYIARAEAKK